MALAEALRGHGSRVATAEDGQLGLERACNLILFDVMMPGVDCYRVCLKLRRRSCKPSILMLTAKGMVDDRVAGLETDADDYLVKPISMKELIARVRALFRRASG
ncbi:MAG: response regulator [Verrucomicrobiaceae bacterium]|nr:response regulator [Verrucomicrobiaceae bacterium]